MSFVYAFRGIRLLIASEPNAKIHLLATVIVCCAGAWFEIDASEWCSLATVIGMVWMAEAFNSSIETAIDLVSPEHHELAGKAKDLAAGGVLLASLSAAIVGAVIFCPRLFEQPG